MTKNSLKDYENSLKQLIIKQLTLTVHGLIFGRSYWKDICIWHLGGLFSGGLIIRRIFMSEIWGAYFRESLFLGWLIIGILWYWHVLNTQKIQLCDYMRSKPAWVTEILVSWCLKSIVVVVLELFWKKRWFWIFAVQSWCASHNTINPGKLSSPA